MNQPRQDDLEISSRLTESEARYRAVIENASDMVQSCRLDGTFEFVNPSWLSKMGYSEEEMKNLVVWDLIDPETLPHCQELFGRAVQGETIENVRATFITKDGRKLPVEGNATPRLVDGQTIATHSFFRDITERLRAEELEALNVQLEKENTARTLEKMAALGKLAAGLAHELNNPAAAAQRAGEQLAEAAERLDAALAELHALGLTPREWALLHAFKDPAVLRPQGRRPTEISRLEEAMEEWLSDHGVDDGWDLAAALVHDGVTTYRLETLAAELRPEALRPALMWLADTGETRELTEVITRSAQRISELVAAVKSYSFMDQSLEQVVDIHEGIENTLTILGHRLRGISVHRDFDRTLPQIRALGSGLNQVWTNILDNAADAAGEGGNVTVRTRGTPGHVVVEIEDDGAGIPPENLTRVFEPFFTTKPQGEGTGLGLEIVWRIVTSDHGGSVSVDSKPGCTRFTVTLPVMSSEG
jgi:PAS domain S-box-containing protein